MAMRRGGRKQNTLSDLFRQIEVSDGCWVWTGRKLPAGYGQFSWNGSEVYVHRMMYELFVGPIPDSLDIDHLCRNRWCCRPAHLEAVSRRVNLLRGVTIPARNANKTHCKNGHVFSEANTHISPHGARQCRACDNEWHKKSYYQKKA